MLSNDGVLSIPFRLGISIVVLSLVMPVCVSCMDSGNTELSRMAALEICKKLAYAMEIVSQGGIGEMRVVDISNRIGLLRPDVEITVGDYPAGPNSTMIICSDSKNWKRVLNLDIDRSIVGICSPTLSPLTVTRQSATITVSHKIIENLNLIIVGSE